MKLGFLRSVAALLARNAHRDLNDEDRKSPMTPAYHASNGLDGDYRYGRDYELYYWNPAPGSWYH